MLVGLGFFGNDYALPQGGGAILGHEFLSLLERCVRATPHGWVQEIAAAEDGARTVRETCSERHKVRDTLRETVRDTVERHSEGLTLTLT